MKYFKIVLICIYCIFSIIVCIAKVDIHPIIETVVLIPSCLWFTLILHEITHLLFFIIYGFKIKELRIGLILFNNNNGLIKMSLVDKGIYYGYCTVVKDNSISKNKAQIALISGGVSGATLCVISIVLLFYYSTETKHMCEFIAMAISGIYGFFFTLVNPNSGDRKQIKGIKEEL